jgi:glyoxylase-like metal-dependent hydrolase (beta-lactamase superfamily II)
MATGPYTIHRIFLGNVSCFLVYRKGEAILVDCGNQGSEVKILETMQKLGMEPGMLRLLILTHVHFDHAGSAARIQAMTGCLVAVHRSEADRLREGMTPIPGGTRWKAKLVVAVGRRFRPRIMKFTGTEPDILVENSLSLDPHGFKGEVIHTPGHTPGSMVILLEGGELLAGDTLFGVEGKQHFPPFAEDLPSLLKSWEMIRSLTVTRIYPAHGRSFSRQQFLDEFNGAMERYG